MAELTHEQASLIVEPVLRCREVTLDDGRLERAIEGLIVASASDEMWKAGNDADEQKFSEEYDQRINRIKALETLIESYGEESDSRRIRLNDGDFESLHHVHFYRSRGGGWSRILKDLRELLAFERELAAATAPEPRPNHRPWTPKNIGARTIFNVLREIGIGTWQASDIIAELLIEAEVEEGDRQRVRHNLYDRLRRPGPDELS